MDDYLQTGIIVHVKVEGDPTLKTIVPLILRFDQRPIFQFIPCFVIDESIFPNLKKIEYIHVPKISGYDVEDQFYVFLMDSINKPRDLIYAGNTSVEKRSIPQKKGNFTDIILIPKDILIRLSFPQLVNPFFLIMEEGYVDESKVAELFKVGLFVHDIFRFDPELYWGRRRVYFNLSRWEMFFSKQFRSRVEMMSSGIDINEIVPMYSQKFTENEAIAVKLPYFTKVKNHEMSLMCRHVYSSLFPDTDFDDEAKTKVSRRRKPDVYFTALLVGLGWIDIVSIRTL